MTFLSVGLLPTYEPATKLWWFALSIYWLSYLVWPFAVWAVWHVWKQWPEHRFAWKSRRVILLAAIAVFVDARFIEPNWITVHETKLHLGIPARVALVSDTHLGVFKGPAYLERLVERLNELDVDAVLIAGDHTYMPDRPLDELLAPWKKSRHPVYSVPGNHDEQAPGPPIQRALRAALERHGVVPIENRQVDLGSFLLVGIADRYQGAGDIRWRLPRPPAKPTVLMFHSPDTVEVIYKGVASLGVAGHTHAGQMRVPVLYRMQLDMATRGGFDHGLYTQTPIPVFVTAGVGESHLPMRFLNPPVIDLLDLN